jgi:biopolymer transport protein ExbB
MLSDITILEILIRGQWVLWVIASCSVVSLGVTLERWQTMRRADVNTEDLLNRVSDSLDAGNLKGAIAVCESVGGPVGETLGVGLRKMVMLERLGKRPEEIEEGIVAAMEEHGLHVVSFLERNLTSLATMASLAPILGMLGTVIGMIKAFTNIGKSGGLTPEAVAVGVGEALFCTAGGLLVAAMSTVEFNYFTSRVNRFVLQVQNAATKLVERVLMSQSEGRLTADALPQTVAGQS